MAKLKKVEGHLCFFCCDGSVFCSLLELEKGVSKMDGGSFAYHSNSEKCDFSQWARDVFGESFLADALFAAREDQNEFLKTLKNKGKGKAKAPVKKVQKTPAKKGGGGKFLGIF